MGNVGFENLKELALALRDTYSLTTFIETGTYKAVTTQWAAKNFERVVSIELDENYHLRAKKIFAKQRGVKLVQGDSATELAKVLKRIKQPALIWLDAHWCKASKATRSECPLREELQAIRESKNYPFIFIDDARLFENPPNEDWPTIQEVIDLLPDRYTYTVWNDAIIAVPDKALALVKEFIKPNQGTTPAESKLEPVILTSNKYLHCLPPFAYLFNKFWPNQSAKVVRYDVRPPKLPDNFTNYAIGRQDQFTWSSGLLKYLDDHQGELILLMLEDYFINGAVRVNDIKWAWECMLSNNPKIVKIDLTNDRLKLPHSGYDDYLIKSAPDSPFQTSLQAAIWRVDFLKRFLDPQENPWQFEKLGTRRVIAAREAGTFDGLILGFKNPPLTYINAIGGEGNNPGLWDNKKIPPWMVDELSRKRLM